MVTPSGKSGRVRTPLPSVEPLKGQPNARPQQAAATQKSADAYEGPPRVKPSFVVNTQERIELPTSQKNDGGASVLTNFSIVKLGQCPSWVIAENPALKNAQKVRLMEAKGMVNVALQKVVPKMHGDSILRRIVDNNEWFVAFSGASLLDGLSGDAEQLSRFTRKQNKGIGEGQALRFGDNGLTVYKGKVVGSTYVTLALVEEDAASTRSAKQAMSAASTVLSSPGTSAIVGALATPSAAAITAAVGQLTEAANRAIAGLSEDNDTMGLVRFVIAADDPALQSDTSWKESIDVESDEARYTFVVSYTPTPKPKAKPKL